MSEKFQTCPGCESLILAETATCPECGHTVKKGAREAAEPSLQRGATVHQTCPKCGDEVPSGLVRCWSCNTFMREDVARKYQALVDNPQKIIFSDVPPDERTETIPARNYVQQGGYARINDQGEAEFVLDGEESDFQLKNQDGSTPSTPTAPASPESPEPKARSTESQGASDPPAEAKSEVTESDRSAAASAVTDHDSAKTDSSAPAPEANADALLNIALTQEKEASFRKRERLAALNQKRIMVPCPSCGVWLKVREEQSGKSVRCRQCKTAIPIPRIRKKESKSKKADAPKVEIDWIDDAHMHLVVPTEIALKPGSLKDSFDRADIAFHKDGLHFIRLSTATPKKSLFSRKVADDSSQQRTENRERIQETGDLSSIPHGETHSIPVENLTAIRLVQPIKKAHESMFAGVSVFGEGRIAVYLPLRLSDDKQAFCSMTISVWRQFAQLLKQHFDVELPAKENGVPAKDVLSSPACHYSQVKVESLRNVEYYENDDAYELELSGYRCMACGIAVSEAARAKNKLGGAAGKSIAKAKCPACSAKFGREPLYRIKRAPEPVESEDSESPATTPASAEAGDG